MLLRLGGGTIFNMFNARLLIQKDLDFCFLMIWKDWKDEPKLAKLNLT